MRKGPPVKEKKIPKLSGKDRPGGKLAEKPSFKQRLLKIEGIGEKTVKDIMETYTERELKQAIKANMHISVRDDIALKLRKNF